MQVYNIYTYSLYIITIRVRIRFYFYTLFFRKYYNNTIQIFDNSIFFLENRSSTSYKRWHACVIPPQSRTEKQTCITKYWPFSKLRRIYYCLAVYIIDVLQDNIITYTEPNISSVISIKI